MSTACINEAKKGYCVYWIAAALFLSIAAIGYIPPLLVGQSLGTTPLIAPMGASAMLMLTLPKSDYAKPWTVLIANAVATVIGLLMPHLISSLVIAGAASMAATVIVMGVLRTIHPPSAGITLMAASLGAQSLPASLAFLIGKVMLGTTLLVVVAVLLNYFGRLIFAEGKHLRSSSNN